MCAADELTSPTDQVDRIVSETIAPSATPPDLSTAPEEEKKAPIPRRKWTKLDSIEVKNFKAVSSALIPVGDVTILVGPNRSGKSSVLQAVHWAARAATYIAPKKSKETISNERIDYLPSSEPLTLAHNGELKSETKTPPVSVIFHHSASSGGEPIQVSVKIWAARNKGGISAHIEGGNAVSNYKERETFLTAYIPGLAGLSEKETILAQPQLRRQAASGDAGSVLRNVLYNLATNRMGEEEGAGAARLKRLNELLSEIHPNSILEVRFNDREDINISATIQDQSTLTRRSLESAATGVLQVAQIFAYMVFFRPKIMLIDEPDAHLHPDKQERLIETLENVSREFDTQILITTHSPHIVRAASPEAKLVWMQDGAVKVDKDDVVRSLLGWGGLDKKALFFIEDEDDLAIRSIMRQWPELCRAVAVCRTFGVDNLPRKKLLEGLLDSGNLDLKAIVHRDRDFMTDENSLRWKDLYKHEKIRCWVTPGCDVEAYFCKPTYLAALFNVSLEQAHHWVEEALPKVSKARDTFLQKRKVIIRLLYENGGGEIADDLWESTPAVDRVVGKSLLKQIKAVIKDAGHDSKLLDRLQMTPNFEMAPDLKKILHETLSD